MSDLVVTCPKALWAEWLSEGDNAGEAPPAEALEYHFHLPPSARPPINPGERVYVVAHGRLRGYAPLVRVDLSGDRPSLVRRGEAIAITIEGEIRGFQGYKARWWDRSLERPFPRWQIEGVQARCSDCGKIGAVVAWRKVTTPRGAVCMTCGLARAEKIRAAGKPLPGWAARLLEGEREVFLG